VYLYHFPELSGVPVSYDLLQQLLLDYPDQIAGVKDSTGDLEGTLGLIRKFPHLDIFTGDDDLLWPVVKAGGAGSMTATANIIPGLLAEIWQALGANNPTPPPAHDLASVVWQLISIEYPIIEALKACLAEMHDDAGWSAVRAPLCELSSSQRLQLIEGITNTGYSLALT
jgi:4-hydroxy-tetrahydrodipicolinate synthase